MTDMPLAGIRVLDLTRVRAGPTCVRQFADWGADVIKIEVPDAAGGDGGLGGPRKGPDFQNLHRNKRSMTLNLKSPEGHAVLLKLAETADIVVENFRPDVKRRLNIAFEDLSTVNEGLIYVSISGFGQDGPYEKRPGVDQIAQGMGGLMSITGEPGRGPMRVGIPVADLTAGLLAAQGAMMALIQRQRTGKGQWVQTSLLQAQVFMLDFQAARWLVDGDVAGQVGNEHPTGVPTNAWATADGHINAAPAGQRLYERFCHAIGTPELIDDPDYVDGGQRYRNRAALNDRIAAILKTKTSAEWIDILNEAGVPCGPINGIDQAFADPQVAHLGLAQAVEDGGKPLTLVGQPIRMSAAEARLKHRIGDKGAESGDILAEAGYDGAEIDRFRRDGVI
ncbi:MAG: CaiB/BaiF CoA transferase family protein [Minwuia sp.]|uniref:CaiB/BaiF CoA transferase family protein n=1 Tax=Minwuia sp. TaxID=2493630 RepID=UPI003A897F67